MDRNYIVELIKENRLQEAIKAIEKATKGSHLHNQIIMLSSSYSEYAQMNRNATQDFQTLEIQRAKITNSLLSFLDELSPEELAQVEIPKKQIQYVQATQPAQTITKTTGIDPKMYLYGAGALLLLAIAYFIFSRVETNDVPIDPPNATPTVLPSANASTDNAKTSGSDQTVVPDKNIGLVKDAPKKATPPVLPSANTSNTNTATHDSNHTVVTGKNVGLVEFDAGQGQVGTFEHNEGNWIEVAHGRQFKFRELKSNETCVYLRDDSRGVTIELNLASKEVRYSDAKEANKFLYKITHVAE